MEIESIERAVCAMGEGDGVVKEGSLLRVGISVSSTGAFDGWDEWNARHERYLPEGSVFALCGWQKREGSLYVVAGYLFVVCGSDIRFDELRISLHFLVFALGSRTPGVDLMVAETEQCSCLDAWKKTVDDESGGDEVKWYGSLRDVETSVGARAEGV